MRHKARVELPHERNGAAGVGAVELGQAAQLGVAGVGGGAVCAVGRAHATPAANRMTGYILAAGTPLP